MMKMKKAKIRIMGSSMISQLKTAPLLGAFWISMLRSWSCSWVTPKASMLLRKLSSPSLRLRRSSVPLR